MYDTSHCTWGSEEVGWLKLYEGSNPQSGGPYFFGKADPSRYHVLKKKTYHFLDFSLHSTKSYSRYKTKVKVKNDFI